MNFSEHAHYGQQSILLKLIFKFELASKVLLEKLVLDKWESCRVKLFDKLVDQLERQQTDCHLRVHVILKHQVVLILILDEGLGLIPPLVDCLQR